MQNAGSLNLAHSQNYLYYKLEYWKVYKTISKHIKYVHILQTFQPSYKM